MWIFVCECEESNGVSEIVLSPNHVVPNCRILEQLQPPCSRYRAVFSVLEDHFRPILTQRRLASQ